MSEIKLAVRSLLRSPGFAFTAVAALALAIGATALVFSAVNAALLHMPGIHDPASLMVVCSRYERMNLRAMPLSGADFVDVREMRPVFSSASLLLTEAFNYTGGEWPQRLVGARVSSNFLATLGATPAHGRDFRPEEDQPNANRVVILSDALWRRLLGGDPGVVGRTMDLNQQPHRIIGIMPPDFQYPTRADFWIPAGLPAERYRPENRHQINFFVLVRLGPGVLPQQASAALAVRSEQVLAREDTDGQARAAGWALWATPFVLAGPDLRNALMLLMGAVGCVLLIACANVAGLMLARGAGRMREVALRVTLGGSRWNVISGVLLESLVLVAAATLGGVLLVLACRPLLALVASQALHGMAIPLDWRVLGAASLAGLASVTLFALAPVLQVARVDPAAALQEGGGRTGTAGKRRQRVRSALVVVEVALAVMLVAGAGLLVRSLIRLHQIDPGFRAEGLVTASLSLNPGHYAEDRLRAFHTAFLERLAGIPGVRAAALASQIPFSAQNWSSGFRIEGRIQGPRDLSPYAEMRAVSPGYFETLQIPLRMGRYLDQGDRKGTEPVIVVDQNLARQYFGGSEVLGQRINLGEGQPWWRVVGVVGHVYYSELALDSGRGVVYFPLHQRPFPSIFAILRTPAPVPPASRAMREALHALDPTMPLDDVKSMQQRIDDSLGSRNFALGLLAVFAAIALAMSALGLYGVISYAVAQRTQEIGVRMALGALAPQLIGMVLKQGLVLGLAGIGAGLAGAVLLARLLRSQLFQVSPLDPAALLTAAGVLLLVVLAASYVPARRAARVDPMVALRHE